MKFFGGGKAAPKVSAKKPAIALRVIPRDQHRISRKNISPNALRVLYKLKEGGFDAFLVGGAVRDLLLGGEPKDFDIATDATPEQVRKLFRNSRLIGRRFRLAHVVFGGEILEVATFRAMIDDGSGDRHLVGGRIVRDNVYGKIAEDAVRRDFTVNALYYSIADFSVHDYVGGYADVERRVLRLIGDVEERYREDPVRMLRAIRLAAKLDFAIEPQAYAAIGRLAPLIAEAAPARLFDELLKLFLSGHAVESFKRLLESGLLYELLPLTARALEKHSKGSGAALIDAALANTDARLAEGKSVTPAFLLAALLWPATRKASEEFLAAGADLQTAWISGAEKVVGQQVKRMALPRRFTIPMQEIWSLQPRFEQMQKKKASRLLAHPRFRAAFDFLALRALDDPALAGTVAWWTEVQGRAPHEFVDAVGTMMESGADADTDTDTDAMAAPARRRRRRRRRGPRNAPEGTTGADA